MIEKDRKFVDRLRERIDGKKIRTIDATLVSILLDVVDRLDKQLTDQNNKLQMVDDLLADAITEAGMQEEYARQLKAQLAVVIEKAARRLAQALDKVE
jgi:hypothetical protein